MERDNNDTETVIGVLLLGAAAFGVYYYYGKSQANKESGSGLNTPATQNDKWSFGDYLGATTGIVGVVGSLTGIVTGILSATSTATATSGTAIAAVGAATAATAIATEAVAATFITSAVVTDVVAVSAFA